MTENIAIHLQSKTSREQIVNRFCKLIAVSALISSLLYIYLKIYPLIIATSLIGLTFLLFIYLNKKGHFHISKAAIILITNIGLLFFSIYLGFNSGIYLYLFVAPFLVYLLYDFNRKTLISFILFSYLANFGIIYFTKNLSFSLHAPLTPESIELIYSFNFCSTFILSFGLITYFANNNNRYIENLQNQQEQLITEIDLRLKSEDLLKKSLKEREILLSEVHHRVKNNLAIITALINLNMHKLKEEKSKEVFEETKNRIFAMALVHNLLYENQSFENIELSKYISNFCKNISASYQSEKEIKIKQEVEEIFVDIKLAVPMALMLNELITNSYKHAFKNKTSGEIVINLKQNNEFIEFHIGDNGCGMNEAFIHSGNMGLEIVHSLIEQIDAVLNYQNKNGSNFYIKIKAPQDNISQNSHFLN